MKIGEWYTQRFASQETFFQPRTEMSGGNFAGILHTLHLRRPQAKAHLAAHVVSPTQRSAWRWVPTSDVPFHRFTL